MWRWNYQHDRYDQFIDQLKGLQLYPAAGYGTATVLPSVSILLSSIGQDSIFGANGGFMHGPA